MNINTAFPSKYLKVADLDDKRVKFTVAAIEMEKVDTKKPEQPVLYFRGEKKGLVLNVTNKNTMVKIYGEETDNWLGQPIVLAPKETEYQGDIVPCIRLEKPVAPAAGKKPPPPPPGDADDNQSDDGIPF